MGLLLVCRTVGLLSHYLELQFAAFWGYLRPSGLRGPTAKVGKKVCNTFEIELGIRVYIGLPWRRGSPGLHCSGLAQEFWCEATSV